MTSPGEPVLRLAPQFVCRVAGLPAAALEDLRAPRSAARVERILALERELETRREEVSEALHGSIAAAGEPASRSAWIALRRDLYNLRPVAPERLEGLPPEARTAIDRLLDTQAARTAARAALRQELAEEGLAARRHLAVLLQDEDFQGALLLSSRTLERSQARYRAAPPEGLKTRERQIERGLLRYLTRMAAKATPFATFCAVLPGEIVDGERTGRLQLAGDPLRKTGHVRLNKAFCGILLSFLGKDPEVRRQLRVEVNPTLHPEGEGRLRFLAAVRGRETFQRLADLPVLQLLRQALSAGASPTLEALAAELARHPDLETSAEEVAAYLDRLIDIGFLRLTPGIPAQELDWDRSLRSLLAGCEGERARKAVVLLDTLRGQAEAYARAPGCERGRRIDEMDECYEAFRAGEDLPFRVKVPLYEDATAAAEARLARSDLATLEADLAAYVLLAGRLSLQRRDLAGMRAFFERQYGPGVESVPLLGFYEDYYREHYKEHLEREGRKARGEAAEGDAGYDLENPFGLESVARLLAARRRVATWFAERWRAGVEQIDLGEQDLRDLAGSLPPLTGRPGFSLTVYADWVPPVEPGGDPRLVVRRGVVTPGYGKMFSRFLYLFPEEFTAALKRRNEALTSDLLAELCEDACFNANLHPPLLPHEIRYPLTEGRGGGAEILPSDLAVVRARGGAEALELRHEPSGRVVLPVDTGFLTPEARPPLYRLLMAFMPGPSVALPLPEGRVEGSQVLVRPRLSFNGRLIFFRRTWLVPASAYPRPQAGEGEDELLLRLARWRAAAGIPEQVYVRFQRLESGENPPAPSTTGGQASTSAPPPAPRPPIEQELEAQKPQIIDFASPLLAGLFLHLLPPGERSIALLEERLPGPDGLAEAQGRGVVSELVLQMDAAEPAARDASVP